MLGGLVVVALVAGLVIGGVLRPGSGSGDNPTTGPGGTAQGGQGEPATPTPEPTPVPTPGHEVYGYLPYWEMTPGSPPTCATGRPHDARPVLGDEQVARRDRHDPEGLPGDHRSARRAADPRGPRARHPGRARLHQLRDDPQQAPVRRANSPKRQAQVIDEPRRPSSASSEVDGINVDVEVIDAELDRRPTARSSAASAPRCVEADPDDQVSVATTAGNVAGGDGPGRRRRRRGPDLPDGLRLPLAGSVAGRLVADRPPRWRRARTSSGRSTCTPRSACPVGADAPRPAALRDDLAGRGAGARGARDRRGDTGSRATHSISCSDAANGRCATRSSRSTCTFQAPDGRRRGRRRSRARRSDPSAWTGRGRRSTSTRRRRWRRRWPSPNDRGLAGVGFWAIGYERGLPDYAALIKRFREGKLE